MLHFNKLAPELKSWLCRDAADNEVGDLLKDAAETLSLRQRVYAPGTEIVCQGDPGETYRLVKSGWAYSAIQLENGERQILDFLLPNDLLEPTLVNGQSHISTHAANYTTMLEFPVARMLELVSRWPEALHYLYRTSARMRAIRMERLVNIGRRDASRRTAHLLLELAARAQPAERGNAVEYECPLTQADLADALGLTAIHVNRTLKELRELSHTLFRNGRVFIYDREDLAAYCGFDGGYLAPATGIAAGAPLTSRA